MFVGILLPKLNLIRFPIRKPSRGRSPGGREGESPQWLPRPRAAPDQPTQAQRKATAQKAAATRRRKSAARSRSAKKAAETRAQAAAEHPPGRSGAGRACACSSRSVPRSPRVTPFSRPSSPYLAGRDSAERELEKVGKRVSTSLKRFERRGTTARNRALREVKKTRTRVERELRQRRTKAVRTVKQNRREAERQVKSARRECRAARLVARLSHEAESGAPGLAGCSTVSSKLFPPAGRRDGTGERLPEKFRRQCSISPPSPAPSPRGRRWSFA